MWTDHTPQAAAIGATMAWRYQTLHSPDWASGGFAAQVMWTGTDGQQSDITWVEAGITHGYNRQNIIRFYTAHGDRRVDPPIYAEATLTSAAPSIGTGYGFEIWAVSQTGTGTYRATVNNTLGSYNWGGHLPNTVNYSGGYEARGIAACDAQVNATYNYRNRYRAKSDGIYRDINNGARTDASEQGTIGWCSSPITFRYWMHSSISSEVC